MNALERIVKALNLEQTRITDAAAKTIAGFGELTELNLSQTEVTDATLKELAALKKLKKLSVNNCIMLSGGGLDELKAAIPGLQIVGP